MQPIYRTDPNYVLMKHLKKIALSVIAASVLSASCTAQKVVTADKKASAKTQALYANLQKLTDTYTLFGHQDDLAYGVGWKFENGRSDVKSVIGSYPAVYGWDIGHIELDSLKELDGVPFEMSRRFMVQVYERGGINTISWHSTNPVNGKSAWDTTEHSVKQLIPGGAKHTAFKNSLDKVAKFLVSLKTADGTMVPVIFRPFHEHTGSWFWWCKNTCTPEEFKSLWRFTVDYLTKTKKLNNLLFSYSSADFNSKEDFLEYYPGDEYIDVVGFDIYCFDNQEFFKAKLDKQLAILQEVAKEHHKIPALTETGYERVPMANWWTETLLPVLSKYNMAYALMWRNDRKEHFYAPYPGQVSADDFIRFYNHPKIMFQDKLTPLKIYK
ncbi:beta-mannanase [Solitalea canadensis DSM 3403]|uniref:Mannan endo-1,4-beta-mannosidase n=2 Tax=Solitalea canadensis TaxID=995 RepID=H8KUR3_SOLCM|nr:beta-mannanase [Solitalea canadensis DSM 3403]